MEKDKHSKDKERYIRLYQPKVFTNTFPSDLCAYKLPYKLLS